MYTQEITANKSVETQNDETHRAETLLKYDGELTQAGWPEVRYVRLWDDSRGPRIREGQSIGDVETYTADEAARLIREKGVRGFYIYADKPSHGTEDLIFTDEDEPDQWPDIRETLTVVSGSRSSLHRTWINDGWESGSEGKDELKGIGGVRVNNTGVVAPGSIHHETDGIYTLVNTCEPSPLSPDDVPEGLRPSSNSSSSQHTYDGLDDPDENAVETVQKAIIGFRTHSETSRRAVEYFEDIREGNNLREHGFIPDDPENKKGCRHEANQTLAGLLHGMLLMDGETDKERLQHLIKEYLAHVAQQYPYTDRGQPRKLRLSRGYISNTVTSAMETFDHETFQKWRRKTKEYNFTGEYSAMTNQTVLNTIIDLSDELDDFPTQYEYPTRNEITFLCQQRDNRSETTYQKALSQLINRHRRVKRADIGRQQDVYYLSWQDAPNNAEKIYPESSGWI